MTTFSFNFFIRLITMGCWLNYLKWLCTTLSTSLTLSAATLARHITISLQNWHHKILIVLLKTRLHSPYHLFPTFWPECFLGTTVASSVGTLHWFPTALVIHMRMSLPALLSSWASGLCSLCGYTSSLFLSPTFSSCYTTNIQFLFLCSLSPGLCPWCSLCLEGFAPSFFPELLFQLLKVSVYISDLSTSFTRCVIKKNVSSSAFPSVKWGQNRTFFTNILCRVRELSFVKCFW